MAFAGVTQSMDAELAALDDWRWDIYEPTKVKDLIDNGKIYENQIHGGAWWPWIDSMTYRQGSHCMGFRVFPNSTGKERTEYWFQGSRPLAENTYGITHADRITWGTMQYTGFSFMVPTSYETGHVTCITQFYQGTTVDVPAHVTLANGSYPYSGQLRCAIKASGNAVAEFTVTKGIWYDIVLQYKFNQNSDAFMEAWYKKASDDSYTNPSRFNGQIGYVGDGSIGLQHKFGIYRPSYPSSYDPGIH